jgi:transcriptional regulator with XRE-family HTH domain
MSTIGFRLRELRLKKELTLSEVAEATGFAVSFLSQLERDKVSISVDNLTRLARFYDVHMVHFFQTAQASQVFVTHREQMFENLGRIEPGAASVALLTNQSNPRMEPLLVHIAPGSEEPHFRQHEADVLIYIISGKARLIAESGEEIELQQGDLAYYVNFPHRRMANASANQPLLLLAITAPPTSSLDDLLEARKGAWVMSEGK